jgi:hypothetical protein
VGPALAPADRAKLKLGLATALTRQGLPGEARGWAQEAASEFSEVGNRFFQARACYTIGLIELAEGRPRGANLDDAARAYCELGATVLQKRAMDELSRARQTLSEEDTAGPTTC